MKPSGFVVLRTPLLPFDTLSEWADGVQAAEAWQASDDALAQALQADRQLLSARLAQLVLQPHVREAIALASRAMAELLRAPDRKRFSRAEAVFVRYLARMSARPTPFGLMAGWTAGELAGETRLELAPRARYRRRTRLDGAALAALGVALVRAAEIRRELPFHPNADAYERAGELRYLAPSEDDEHGLRWRAVERSAAVTAALACAGAGAGRAQIAKAITRSGSSGASAFVDALIDARALVADCEAPASGDDPLSAMTRALASAGPASRAAAAQLALVQRALAAADAKGLIATGRSYRQATAALTRLAPLGARPAFAADLIKPAAGGLRLGAHVVAEVQAAIAVLQRIATRAPDLSLQRFRDAFRRRYGARQVRLVDALDPESGIGFALCEREVVWSAADAARLELLRRAWSRGEREIALSRADLRALEASAPAPPQPLPDALAALVTVGASSEPALQRGQFRVLVHTVDGPSGARLLGRACSTDPDVHAHVAAHLRAEEALRPGVVFVEVLVAPKPHHRNAITRPVLRDHELAIACRSGAPRERQIALADLVLAVEDERVVLRSERLGCELAPRLSCALNRDHPEHPALLRLLGALERQGVADGLRFEWGALASARFLPRVRHGRAVLCVARWRVPAALLKSLPDDDDVAELRRVQALRAELDWPRFVTIEGHDEPLTVDLDNPLCVDALLREARKGGELRIAETFPDPAELCVRGPEGRYAHELIIPFIATKRDVRPAEPARTSMLRRVRARDRAATPGTDWLYLKVYAGTAVSDRVLCSRLVPTLRRALRSGAIDRWFFVRYGDPEPHLRVRAHGRAKRLAAEVLPSLARALRRPLDDESVWRVQLDSYQRELERYGGPAATDLAERVFWLDSEAVAGVLAYGADGRERRLLAIAGIDRLLRALGLDRAERSALVATARDTLARELDTKNGRRERAATFRAERSAIAALLAPRGEAQARCARAFAQRDAGVLRAAGRLRALDRAGELATPLPEIFASYVHMHANRVFASEQRRSELEALDLLQKHYTAQAAR